MIAVQPVKHFVMLNGIAQRERQRVGMHQSLPIEDGELVGVLGYFLGVHFTQGVICIKGKFPSKMFLKALGSLLAKLNRCSGLRVVLINETPFSNRASG